MCILMAPNGYLISRCPHCSSYVHTPTQHLLRLCLHCHRIFRVEPLRAQYIRDKSDAIARVRYYRTGKHHEEFVTAVEQSRIQVAELVPCVTREQEEIQENEVDSVHPSQQRLLNRLLRIHAGFAAANLQLFKKECEKAGLSWLWVSRQIEALVRAGRLVCPKPWKIHLVTATTTQTELTIAHNSTALAKRLGEIIRNAKTPVTLASLMVELGLEKAVTGQVEEALERLMAQGFIFRTTNGRYRWIGD